MSNRYNETCQSWVDIGDGLEIKRCEGNAYDIDTPNNLDVSSIGVGIYDGTTFQELKTWDDLGIPSEEAENFRAALDVVFGSAYCTFGCDYDLDMGYSSESIFSIETSGHITAWTEAHPQTNVRDYIDINAAVEIDIDVDALQTAFEVAICLVALIALYYLGVGIWAGSVATQLVRNLMYRGSLAAGTV